MFLVSWGSYFDFAINWNKHLDDENVKFILYEDLKEVRLWLLIFYSKIIINYNIEHLFITSDCMKKYCIQFKKKNIPDTWYSARGKNPNNA